MALGVLCSVFALGEDMATLDLVNLGGLGIGFAPGVDMDALVLVNLGGLGTVFAPGVGMATLFLVYLGGLGCVFGIEEDMAGLVLVTLGGVGTVSVVSVVWLPLVVRWPCSWLLLEMAFGFGLAFKVFLGGKGCLGLGGGRPTGEGMAALCLVILVGVRGGYWFAAAIVATFCFFCYGRVPRTIGLSWQEKNASY